MDTDLPTKKPRKPHKFNKKIPEVVSILTSGKSAAGGIRTLGKMRIDRIKSMFFNLRFTFRFTFVRFSCYLYYHKTQKKRPPGKTREPPTQRRKPYTTEFPRQCHSMQIRIASIRFDFPVVPAVSPSEQGGSVPYVWQWT